jgi:hypothetical protein
MAHMSIPLTDGLLDGIKEVIQHTWLACVNYARQTRPPHDWRFSNLYAPSRFRGRLFWQSQPERLPPSLQKMGFQHIYVQDCCLYLRNDGAAQANNVVEGDDWQSNENILGRIRLLHTSKELLTEEELRGKDDEQEEDDANDNEDDDMPVTVLYKVEVEYRSLPPTGSHDAVEAEELSMLSFGSSIDDDVKYGALAALYDPNAKYVLEIHSVRGKVSLYVGMCALFMRS